MSSQSFPPAFVALALGGLSLAALATSQGSGGPVNVTPEDIAPEALVQAPDSVCALSFEPSGSGALLSASVHPEATMSGTYALTVTRQSGGNRSSIRQGGAFLAPGGELTVLSLSLVSRSSNTADHTCSWQTFCSSVFRQRPMAERYITFA